ncbi:unnamed protein product [Prorocentrum cordatum]|uniref:Uncharacterized protein n=1 Tax=Prorocentrum cordatum TaxID=2364126 RepID=A0ABN9W3I9_9DINO|nr:unnamed protein product [Polarella glacialis]
MWHGMGVSKMSSHMVDLRPLAAQKRLRTHSSVLRQKKSARGALRGAQRAHARGLRGEASIYKLAPLAKCQMGPTVHILRCAEVNNRELQLNNNPRNPSSIVPPHDPARLIHAAALLTGVLGQLCATTARTRDGFRPMGGKEEEEEEEEEEEQGEQREEECADGKASIYKPIPARETACASVGTGGRPHPATGAGAVSLPPSKNQRRRKRRKKHVEA